MTELNALGHGPGLTGWVDYEGGINDGPNIPVKLTLNWINTVSEIAI